MGTCFSAGDVSSGLLIFSAMQQEDDLTVIEAVRVSGLPAGVKLYSATIDNRKNSTTVSTEILDTDILHQTSTGVPYDASVSLNNLSQAEKSNTYSSEVPDYYAAGNSAGAYGMRQVL